MDCLSQKLRQILEKDRETTRFGEKESRRGVMGGRESMAQFPRPGGLPLAEAEADSRGAGGGGRVVRAAGRRPGGAHRGGDAGPCRTASGLTLDAPLGHDRALNTTAASLPGCIA